MYAILKRSSVAMASSTLWSGDEIERVDPDARHEIRLILLRAPDGPHLTREVIARPKQLGLRVAAPLAGPGELERHDRQAGQLGRELLHLVRRREADTQLALAGPIRIRGPA